MAVYFMNKTQRITPKLIYGLFVGVFSLLLIAGFFFFQQQNESLISIGQVIHDHAITGKMAAAESTLIKNTDTRLNELIHKNYLMLGLACLLVFTSLLTAYLMSLESKKEELRLNSLGDMTEKNLAVYLKEQQINQLMNSIADYAIVMLNPQGKIAEWNVGAYNIYGYESNEVINCHFSLFYQPEAIEKTHPERELSNALLTGRHQEEGLRIRKDGSTFWAYSIITPIYDNEKKLVGFAKITRDLSEQKRMEEKMKTVLIELKRSNEDLSNFAYVASHDLKAPLRAIESLSAWIEQDKLNRLTPESKENLHMLHQRTQRMSNLIDGILQYARADQMDKATSLVNLRELLDEVILSLDLPSAFQIHYPDNLPIFETSKIRLSQVFSNLIDNGIKYHDRKEGRIDIGFKDAGRFYEFSVTDDGPGIDPAYHDRIFEIFQTLQSRDTIESTGIGLSIVKKIIEVQGGYIRILSTAGKGATFQFTWPKRPDL